MTRHDWLINKAYEIANEMAVAVGDMQAIEMAGEWIRQQAAYGENIGPVVVDFTDSIMMDWGHVVAAERA